MCKINSEFYSKKTNKQTKTQSNNKETKTKKIPDNLIKTGKGVNISLQKEDLQKGQRMNDKCFTVLISRKMTLKHAHNEITL